MGLRYFVGNKAKGRNLQTGVTRKQGTPNFPKNEHFFPPDTHTSVCVSGGDNCSFFGKFSVLCFLVTPVSRFAYNWCLVQLLYAKYMNVLISKKVSATTFVVSSFFIDDQVKLIMISKLS